jgi:hypothetical protein
VVRFVIDERDDETNSILESHFLDIEDFSGFKDKLGFDPRDCLATNASYDLSRKDMRLLARYFGLKPVSAHPKGDFLAFLPFHEYPYKLHSNRELLLMLKGEKPLAYFTHEVELISKKSLLNGQRFQKYVDNGRIIKKVNDLGRPHGTRLKVYYYSLPGEEWRIQAHMMLMEMLHKGLWDKGLERMEGQLLGYTGEQNDIHLARTPLAPSLTTVQGT